MELTVYWTQTAEDKLNDIFEYYKFNAGVRIAKKLINGIIDTSLELDKNAYGGQKEILLENRIQGFRYTVFKNYKILYWIDETNKIIFISNIFDSRQNPNKINQF
jgi:plasmid stabilization system protein ParE